MGGSRSSRRWSFLELAQERPGKPHGLQIKWTDCWLSVFCRDVKLTKKERAELDYKKEVLRLAKEKRKHLQDIEDKEVYRMPDSYEEAGSKRHDQLRDLLLSRYQCAPSTSACLSHHGTSL